MAPVPNLAIAPFDPTTAADDELTAVYGIVRAGELEQLPDDAPRPFEEWLHDERFTVSFRRRRRWVARVDGGIVGWAWGQDDLENNTHFTWSSVAVLAEWRRMGIGTELLGAVVDASRAAGRTSVILDVREDFAGSVAFATRFGLTPRIRAHQNRLLVDDLDLGMLRAWVARAEERAGGYDLLAWDGPTPADLVDRFAPFTEVMNTAPTDDLDWEDETETPERLVERETAKANQGYDWWTACAVERASGELAGYTQLYFSPWRPDIAFQGDTGVDPAHRDRGIGRWLKAVNLLRLVEERPSVRKVDTENAGSNDAMLAINHALGFEAIAVWVGYQADIDVIEKHLEEKR